MINRIELENFKGIQEKIALELKPITLLFGANSSGKSTILHSLHYAFEVLRNHNLNADRTTRGGMSVDLGGFRNMVHAHDLDKRITMRFDFDTNDSTLPDHTLATTDVIPETADIDDLVLSAWVRVEVGWSRALGAPQAFAYEVGVNGSDEPVIRIEAASSKGQTATLTLNIEAPIFDDPRIGHDEDGPLMQLLSEAEVPVSSDRRASFTVYDQSTAIPVWGRPLRLWTTSDTAPTSQALGELGRFVSKISVGIGELLVAQLERLLYVGPLRVVPPRNFRPALADDPSRWADGLGAWDAMYRGGPQFVSRVSEWMKRLEMGYHVQIEHVSEISSDIRAIETTLSDLIEAIDKHYPSREEETELVGDEIVPLKIERFKAELLRQGVEALRVAHDRDDVVLVDDRSSVVLCPYDVGVGISQVLPVIVAALYRGNHGAGAFVAIEHPELHIHPKLQVALADLFIEQSTLGTISDHCFLLETHSEHLLLRLLRRIREAAATKETVTEQGGGRISSQHIGVIYVQRADNGTVRFVPLAIDDRGEFLDVWPEGYFDERMRELF